MREKSRQVTCGHKDLQLLAIEVMVHCQNFPKSVDVIKDLLEKTITPYLVKVMAQHQMVMEPSSVKWVNHSNVCSWKVVVENTDVANI